MTTPPGGAGGRAGLALALALAVAACGDAGGRGGTDGDGTVTGTPPPVAVPATGTTGPPAGAPAGEATGAPAGEATGGGSPLAPLPEPLPGPPSERPAAPVEGERYERLDHGFAITFPDDWVVLEDQYGLVVAGAAPDASPEGYSHNVGIAVEDLPYPLTTVEEYADLSLDGLPGLVPGFTLEGQEPVTLGGRPAWSLRFTGQPDAQALRFLTVSTVVAGRAYTVTYTADADVYDRALPAANEIIDSFELLFAPGGTG